MYINFTTETPERLNAWEGNSLAFHLKANCIPSKG